MTKIVQIKEKEGKVLRLIAEAVKDSEFGSKELLKNLAQMKKALMSESDGVAIAAPQISISKRMFVINPIAYNNAKIVGEPHEIFINPRIAKISKDKKLMEEGCLSVRPLYGKVRRATNATIVAQDENGKEFEISGAGLVAQIFQHETDHLDGVLFVDKAKEVFELVEVKNKMLKEKSQIKFAFFGTDQFSVFVLDELLLADLKPSLLITPPDRIKGRGLETIQTDTKKWAIQNGVEILEVEKFNDEIVEKIKSESFDLCALASYGKIIPQRILDVCGKGILNVHPSLLPKYRGASPLESAILGDYKRTGVTIMLMDAVMDHGPIISQEIHEFSEWPSKNEVEEILARIGGKNLASAIMDFASNEEKILEQNHDQATFTKKIEKPDGEIKWTESEREIFLKIIAMNPWPGAFFFHKHLDKDIRIKITEATWTNNHLQIEKVIPEGRHEMTFSDFCRGFNFELPSFN